MSSTDLDRQMSSELASITGISEHLRETTLEKVLRITRYIPTVAFLGATGAGKSSLGSALFGREVFKVSSVRAGTRTVQRERTTISGVEIDLLDFPGVGESRDRDEEYRKLYSEWIGRIDVVLWLVKVDDRALAKDVEFLENVIRPAKFPRERLLFVVSQADKADPFRDWNISAREPGERQQRTISEKIDHVRELFGAAPSSIVPVSAEEGYNLDTLAAQIVRVCPNEAALNIARTLGKEVRTDEVRKTVFEKILQSFQHAGSLIATVVTEKLVERLFARLFR